MVLKPFLAGKDVFALLPIGFGQSLASVGSLVSPLAPVGSLEMLSTGSTGSNKTDWSALNVIDRWLVQSPSKVCFFSESTSSFPNVFYGPR